MPSWTQDGRDLPRDDPDRLKEVAARFASLQEAVARAQAALDAAVGSRR